MRLWKLSTSPSLFQTAPLGKDQRSIQGKEHNNFISSACSACSHLLLPSRTRAEMIINRCWVSFCNNPPETLECPGHSLACLVPPSPLTFANIILVFATSSGVVTAAANPPEKIKIASTSETLLCEYECHTAYNSQGCGQHCSVINAYSTFPHVRAQVCLSKVCTQMFCFCVLTLENSSLLLNCKSKHPQGHRCLFVLDSVHI